MFIARNIIFYPGYSEDNIHELSDEIMIPSFHLNKLMDRFQDNEPLLITMTNIDTDLKSLVAIGQPHSYDKNTIFVPQWILDSICHSGISDNVITLEKTDATDIPVATKITIKPLDPVAFELDTSACFEKAMMNLHSIKKNSIIPIIIPELGSAFTLYAHIEDVEPAALSRIVNGEVEVDFINEFAERESAPFRPIPAESIMHDDVALNSVFNEIESLPLHSIPITPTQEVEDADADEADAEELTAEERREQVRKAWLTRFQNTSATQ